MKALENELEYERKNNSDRQRDILDKDAEIELLNTIKKCQEEKIEDYM